MKHITYEYPCADIKNLVVTNSREVAAHFIEDGYELFSVPQMFSEEHGVIVLYLENSHSRKENGIEILKNYEDESRNHASGGSSSSVHANVIH